MALLEGPYNVNLSRDPERALGSAPAQGKAKKPNQPGATGHGSEDRPDQTVYSIEVISSVALITKQQLRSIVPRSALFSGYVAIKIHQLVLRFRLWRSDSSPDSYRGHVLRLERCPGPRLPDNGPPVMPVGRSRHLPPTRSAFPTDSPAGSALESPIPNGDTAVSSSTTCHVNHLDSIYGQWRQMLVCPDLLRLGFRFNLGSGDGCRGRNPSSATSQSPGTMALGEHRAQLSKLKFTSLSSPSLTSSASSIS
ncbi:hypothetical protein Dimus_028157 [Dionaea muscipula]